MPPAHQNTESRRLKTDAAADYLGLSASLLEKDRVSGRLAIPYLKLGKAVVYDTAALDQWMAEHAHCAVSKAA
jgi:hypothetical protein